MSLTDAAGLRADELRILARMAAGLGPVLDMIRESADRHAQATGNDVDRPVLVAELALALRRTIDTTPDGWVLLTAELALRDVEGPHRQART